MIRFDANRTQIVALTIVLLVSLRLVAATFIPLAYDEAYYWTWSKHLALGYFDHPPMVALIIRLGTAIAGDTQLGVRIISVLLALPASWAIWRSAKILFPGERVAADAALYFNLTLMVAAGTIIVTPDSPLILGTAFVLYSLARLHESGHPKWWIAIGVAIGFSLLSKYTALFFGTSILAWLVLVPEERRWLKTPWPYAGAIIAFAMFAPVIWWNAHHHWASFAKQFGRAVFDRFTLKYVFEVLPGQFGLVTPSVFILACLGVYAMSSGRTGKRGGAVMITAFIWPIALYFSAHMLHQRVQANWLSPLFPPMAIAAAVAATAVEWRGRARWWADTSRRWAVPVGTGCFALVCVQAIWGVPIYGKKDPTARLLAVGMPEVGEQIEAIRLRQRAAAIVTTSYGITGWLSFYVPTSVRVIQLNQRIRWVDAPQPSPELMSQPLLYVVEQDRDHAPVLARLFRSVKPVGSVYRKRRETLVHGYRVYVVQGPLGDPLDAPAYAEHVPKDQD